METCKKCGEPRKLLWTRTMHPPGGATAFVAVYNQQGFAFIFTPIAFGAALLILVAIMEEPSVFNNVSLFKFSKKWQ